MRKQMSNSTLKLFNEAHSLKREYYPDTVGGILLIYMILTHCFQWASLYPEFDRFTYFLNFFMPWFFFKGGMFYKPRTNKEIVKIGYKRLIVPFIWFSIIGTIILWIKYIILGIFTLRQIASPLRSLILTGSVPGNAEL